MEKQSFEIIWHIPQVTSLEGEIIRESEDKKYNIPFGFYETVYYVFQKRKKVVY